MACADATRGEDRRIVAVIGDGAMASGMAFEALNHAGALGRGLLVVLNDNKMSISRSVGAIARYLSKIRSSHPYTDLQQELQDLRSAAIPWAAPLRGLLGTSPRAYRRPSRPAGSSSNWASTTTGP